MSNITCVKAKIVPYDRKTEERLHISSKTKPKDGCKSVSELKENSSKIPAFFRKKFSRLNLIFRYVFCFFFIYVQYNFIF